MSYDVSERAHLGDSWPEIDAEAAGSRERDRLGVHLVWETLLTIIVVGSLIIAYQINPDSVMGPGLPRLLVLIGALGFAAVGMAWSLRAAVPNLAVGATMIAGAGFLTQQSGSGVGPAVVVTLGAALAIGVVLSVMVVAFHVPAWAGSLAVALALAAWPGMTDGGKLPADFTYDPTAHAVYWFVAFCVLSLVGGGLGLLAPARRGIGGYRATTDPAVRPGFVASFSAMLAVLGSCFFAAAGGILLVLAGETPKTGDGVGWTGFSLTGLVLGAVLLGGVSGYGRRGGLFGTLLGVTLVALLLQVATVQQWRTPIEAYAAVAVMAGLLVTRLVELAGRRKTTPEGEQPSGPPEPEPSPPAAAAPAAPALPAAESHPMGDRASRLSGQLGHLKERSSGGVGPRDQALFRTSLRGSQVGPRPRDLR